MRASIKLLQCVQNTFLVYKRLYMEHFVETLFRQNPESAWEFAKLSRYTVAIRTHTVST